MSERATDGALTGTRGVKSHSHAQKRQQHAPNPLLAEYEPPCAPSHELDRVVFGLPELLQDNTSLTSRLCVFLRCLSHPLNLVRSESRQLLPKYVYFRLVFSKQLLLLHLELLG